MANHHEPFKVLGPIVWDDVPQDGLAHFLQDIFFEAQTVVDSIPSTEFSNSDGSVGRARAKTDSAVLASITPTNSAHVDSQSKPAENLGVRQPTPASVAQAEKLQKEWKEVKINQKENPLNVQVHKLAAKDGKGAWFARRSLHDGLSFEQWRDALQKEFLESMKVQGQPGSGSIRGIGADKRVEDHTVQNTGHVQVFQLSAQFPGPTSPRDFITLLLTSETPRVDQIQESSHRPLRQFIIVSKPCIHPECPPRQGIIRGQYESVELIREVYADDSSDKRTKSVSDLSTTKNYTPADSTARPRGSTSSDQGHSPDVPVAIEWLMVTRSDPGGSVPRFMIEKGTPPGIVNDAGKFLKWIKSKPTDEPSDAKSVETDPKDTAAGTTGQQNADPGPQGLSTANSEATEVQQGTGDDAYWSNGVLGMITGAFEAASSVMTTGLRKPFTGEVPEDDEDPRLQDDTYSLTQSETSSVRSFASALERSLTDDKSQESIRGSQSDDKSQDNAPQIKELKRLEERRRKLDEKAAKMAERLENKRQGDKDRDAVALAKAREKHEKEIAKHELKYKRELRKLEEKREQEERKAEERRKKAVEREEKSNLALELERVRAERDVALKQAELLKIQVGELQAQNTMLVARLGKVNGVERVDSASSSSKEWGHGTDQGTAPKLS